LGQCPSGGSSRSSSTVAEIEKIVDGIAERSKEALSRLRTPNRMDLGIG
jgi:hypothetical protein